MRVETIGDDGVIDGVKKGVLCCAMSEMPFGEGMRGAKGSRNGEMVMG